MRLILCNVERQTAISIAINVNNWNVFSKTDFTLATNRCIMNSDTGRV